MNTHSENLVVSQNNLAHLNKSYDLGDSIFHAEHGELHSKLTHEVIHIEKKVAEVFRCLAQADGEIVTREEIFAQVWPHQYVSDDSLNRCISVLRKTFKQFGHGLAITTHPKVGFNLIYPARCDISIKPKLNLVTPAKTGNKHYPFYIGGIVMILVVFFYWFVASKSPLPAEPPVDAASAIAERVVIMPFEIEAPLAEKYQLLESRFRQLLSNLPGIKLVDKSDTLPFTAQPTPTIAEFFQARYIIKANIYQQNAREIINWRLIDALTTDELSNRNLNLILNTTEANARSLTTDFVLTHAKKNFNGQKNQQIGYILSTAKYLHNQPADDNAQRPVISMLAQTLSEIDANSVPTLILLAQLLSKTSWNSEHTDNPFISLAIKTLNQAIKLSPNTSESYLALAEIYQLKYQWLKAHDVLSQLSTSSVSEMPNSVINLQRRTATIDSATLTKVKQAHILAPTDQQKAMLLISLLIEQQQFTQALEIADAMPISIHAWGADGAIIGPIYVASGRKNKADALTIAGYLTLGVKPQYAQLLIQGIRQPETAIKAQQALQQAQQNGEFSKKVLLQMYEQLNAIDAYMALALKLADSSQFDVLTSYRFNAQAIRRHPNHSHLMEKIQLVPYWHTVNKPYYCQQLLADYC